MRCMAAMVRRATPPCKLLGWQFVQVRLCRPKRVRAHFPQARGADTYGLSNFAEVMPVARSDLAFASHRAIGMPPPGTTAIGTHDLDRALGIALHHIGRRVAEEVAIAGLH